MRIDSRELPLSAIHMSIPSESLPSHFAADAGGLEDAVVCATSDQDVHGLGIYLSNLGATNCVDQNKKEQEENGCV